MEYKKGDVIWMNINNMQIIKSKKQKNKNKIFLINEKQINKKSPSVN